MLHVHAPHQSVHTWKDFFLHIAIFPLVAEAFARVGRDADADTALAAIPPDVYGGFRARARVAMLRQNYAAAETALAEALRQAPSITRAYKDWGDLLAKKGDLAGAVMEYAEANRRGPHWADPLEAWGEVHAQQGKITEALAKYDEALRYAPNRQQLNEEREANAKHAS